MTIHRYVLHVVQRACIWLGLLAVAFAGGTAVYAEIAHRYESWTFDAARAGPDGPRAPARPDLRTGDMMGRLEIPRIGVSVMIRHGADEAILALGAGHVPATPSPGGDGNVVVAAHRDTFFRRLEGIRPGDRVQILTVGETYEYVVDSTETVDPDDTRVMESRARQELTLITCYPFSFVGPAPRRFIVHARALIGRRDALARLGR